MARTFTAMMALALVVVGVAQAQQPAVREVRPQPTRSYRSYSVTPAPRGDVRRTNEHDAHATWRHADSKAQGRFRTGR